MTDTEKLDTLIELVKDNNKRLENVEKEINNIQKEVTGIKVTLENETNRNIRVIAEGHLDLSRKLNEAVRIASDIKAKQEMQDIYLNTHETKLNNKN
jgi:seryl-tRNA synthetase